MVCWLCSSRKNPHPPRRSSVEIPGEGGGVLRDNILEAMYEDTLEFPGGRGSA